MGNLCINCCVALLHTAGNSFTRPFGFLTVALCCVWLAGCSNSQPQTDTPTAQASNVLPVSAESAQNIDLKNETVERRSLARELHVTGRIQAEVSKEIDVSPRFSGRVVEIDVTPGQRVQKGQLLAKVDSQEVGELQAELIEAQSKLDIARAHEERERQIYEEHLARPKELLAAQTDFEQIKVQLQLAESEYKRAEDLYKEKIASARDFQSAKANVEKLKVQFREAESMVQREQVLYKNRAILKKDLALAKAETARAKQHVDTLTQRLTFLGVPSDMVNNIIRNGKIEASIPIRSPSDGIVTDQKMAVGEMVSPDKKFITVTDLSVVVLSADIPEVDVRHVQLGLPVDIKVAAFPEEKFTGTIRFISEQVNPATRTVAIRARLPNPQHKLKTNMFAEIDLPTAPSMVLACPKSAVQERSGSKVVYVATAAGYREHKIQIGKEFQDYVEVLAGLEEGDRVATQGSLLLRTAMAAKAQTVNE